MGKYQYSKVEQSILEKSGIPLAIYQYIDNKIETILLSEGFLKLFGYDDRESTYQLMNNDMYKNVHPDDIARFTEASLSLAREDIPLNVLFRSITNGDNKIVHAFGEHIYTEDGTRLALIYYMDEGEYLGEGILQDDFVERRYSASLAEISSLTRDSYDFLTGLPVMSYFFDLARASRIDLNEKGQRCSLCFANLNGLRHYNRKYGFVEGDNLIKTFAGLLAKYFGKKNCSRIGQDNFSFFALSDNLEELLNELFKEFAEIFKGRNISVRVGIYPDTLGIIETNIACDRAKYACNTLRDSNESKFVYFDESMLEFENRRQYIIDNLDKAIEERWIQAYFQPLVRTANGRVSDEESLARWIDPEKGLLSPAEFIPILEDAKLIYKVDLHILDMTIEKMKKQEELGFYVVPASINLSRTDFDCCDIVEEICKRVDAAGMEKNLFSIEITESVVGEDFEFIKEQVERFQSLGFPVWMDDFGSGYSSLDVLQDIHFDLIKLDMRFMKQFNNDEKSRVIITELVKMAIGLGIETVTEGVETKEQVEFLQEVGCTKLQGYYYCKPISFADLVKRYEEGRQIGFENPAESAYYESLGRINLYDMAIVASDEELLKKAEETAVEESENSFEEDSRLYKYFNTLPMAVIETDDTIMQIVRCNQTYRTFMGRFVNHFEVNVPVPYESLEGGAGDIVAKGIRQCAKDGKRVFVDERIDKDSTIHAMIRRVATNPVTGVVACAMVVLGVMQDSGRGVTYADIANSLSADYINLYYVNIDTEDFVEYRHDSSSAGLAEERRGKDFFAASKHDALEYIFKDDQQKFIDSFSRENVLRTIDEHGSYTITYRLLIGGKPTYVSMKAIRMSDDESHIIVGVSNVDAYMRQREALERMREEQTTFSKITALSGDYICIYSVNLETEEYSEYSATQEYEGLGLAKKGDNFFARVKEDSREIVYDEDRDMVVEMVTKDNILNAIKLNGVFVLNYRIIMEDKPVYVVLKGAVVEEKDGPQLIIGVSNIDIQVRRDMEYERLKSLSEIDDDDEYE